MLSVKSSDKTPSKRLERYSDVWPLTWSQTGDTTKEAILTHIRAFARGDYFGYTIGRERHEETDGWHIHAYIRFDKRRRCRDVHKALDYEGLVVNVGSRMTAGYPTKDGDFISNMPPCERLYTERALVRYEQLYGWQLDVIDMLSEPATADDRTVHWYWSKDGKKGKTTLVKYLKQKCRAKLVGGASADALYAIGQADNPPIVCINVARRQYNRVSYVALESIKDGIFFAKKYESKDCEIHPCHVLVFANFPPEQGEDVLSEDRWHIVNIDPKEEPPAAGAGSD